MRFVLGMMLLAVLGFSTVGMTGCSSNTDVVSSETQDDHDHEGEDHASHDHSGWWCAEHGVPEEECALCDSSLVADFKAKGDWCSEHNRPDSQCFECNPGNREQFVARYEAKFGEQPPKPTE